MGDNSFILKRPISLPRPHPLIPVRPATAPATGAPLPACCPIYGSTSGASSLPLPAWLAAKSANVGVPLLLKQLIECHGRARWAAPRRCWWCPWACSLAYGALRFANSLFNELREFVFSKATHGAARSIALATFEHLHRLSLRFHLERQTGGMTRDIERGVRGIESLVSFALFNIVATFIEVLLVLTVLGNKLDIGFALITLARPGGVCDFYRGGDRMAHPVSPPGQPV